MVFVRSCVALALAACVPTSLAQINAVMAERSLMTSATASNVGGGSVEDFDSDFTEGTSPFIRTIAANAAGIGGALANGTAIQDSDISSTRIYGDLEAHGSAFTGSNIAPAQADAESNLLFIFNLTEATPIEFFARGKVTMVGRNEDGEPSDLYGWSRVRLINADTEEPLALLNLMMDKVSDEVEFNGTLAAGRYAIIASTKAFVYSADLLGPPPRSGLADSEMSFSLTVVPTPGAATLMLLAGLGATRRRRN